MSWIKSIGLSIVIVAAICGFWILLIFCPKACFALMLLIIMGFFAFLIHETSEED